MVKVCESPHHFERIAMTETSPVRPVPVDRIPAWDLEADVVIAGYGIAGVCAAVGAAAPEPTCWCWSAPAGGAAR
ncbi:hypothetical protein GQ85_39740, partial [Rhodococcus rhodochrous]